MAAPLAIAGSQAAHVLAYLAVAPEPDARRALLAATGHGYLHLAPLLLALGTVTALLGLAGSARIPDPVSGQRLGPFLVFAPAVFALQEHLERALHDGAFPIAAATEPTFLLGLALQIPFALLAYGVARLLLRVARVLAHRAARPGHRSRWPELVAAPSVVLNRPREVLLAAGNGSRGPPLPVG